MTNTAYARFLKARAKMQRALGQAIVEHVEQGCALDSLINAQTGLAHGSDMEPSALIMLSGVSHGRKMAALKALRA